MLIENQTGKKIKHLRIDNGLEFCEKEGIIIHRTMQKTPQQNDVAEHMNCSFRESSLHAI